MARLNDPEPLTATTETAEAIKRKALRQNTILARTNAAHTAKIRSLEVQISNLLSENLSFRDTIVHLQVELDESRQRTICQDVTGIQRQLEEKMRECAEIVAQLGGVEKRSRHDRTAQTAKTSPDAREWRTRATLSEVLETQPGHLPTIVEGKYFPRRTLDAAEINSIIHEESTDSPAVGPPPAMHLVYHSRRLSQEQQDDLDEARLDPQPSGLLSANFETRKRRRETYVRPDEVTQIEESHLDQPFLKTPERLQGKPVRASRKRRLSTQRSMEEDRAESHEFVYTRKDSQDPEKQIGQAQMERLVSQPNAVESKPDMMIFGAPQSLASPSRPALSTRTTNISPKKTNPSLSAKDDKKKPIIEDRAQRASRHHQVEIPSPQLTVFEPEIAEVDVSTIKLEPRTPAFAALNSPTSTQPSELRADSRDTPPPGNLAQSHSTTEGGAAARGSRRARTQVNYAEPSLISKMRRPTKELVAAVGKDARRSLSAEPGKSIVGEGQQPVRVVTIKREQDSGEWKPTTSSLAKELSRPEPLSPTLSRQEDSVQQLASGRLSRRDRRMSSELAISGDDQARNDLGLARKMQELEVFDVKTSSPVLQSIETESAEELVVKAAPRSRRQSLAPSRTTLDSTSRPGLVPATAKAVVGPAHQRALSIAGTDRAGKLVSVDRGGAVRGRRRSMLM